MGGDVPVGIVGGGPVGLACALRLASFGVGSMVLEVDPDLRQQGSRACCVQGDVVEILDKVGVGAVMAGEGVPWSVGRTYVGGRELARVEYPRNGAFPAWVNVSQHRTQQIMLDRLAGAALAEVRWSHRVVGVAQDPDGVTVRAETPDGVREYRFGYLVGCDGVHSTVREQLGVAWTGYRHADRFLIADIRAELPLAHERHFHYDPPFNPGRQMVLHAQPDRVWRIDWQLAPDADIEAEQRDGRFDRRVRAVIGDLPYEVCWLSTYRFNQLLAARMRIGRVLLAGDAAHALPPYGARGMNSGVQDIDNLAWKLAHVLAGQAEPRLLESYHTERHAAARENLRVTGNTLRFMVPVNPARRWLRNALLRLAPMVPVLRGRVDSGKMSEPFVYRDSPLLSGPADPLRGAFAPDTPITVGGTQTRLRRLLGAGFVGIHFGPAPDARRFAAFVLESHGAAPNGSAGIPLRLYAAAPAADLPAGVGAMAAGPDLSAYQPGRWYLFRPDSHVAATGTDPGVFPAALRRASAGVGRTGVAR